MDNPTLYSVITCVGDKHRFYKRNLRAEYAHRLANSLWKNNQPLDCVQIVNQRTGKVRNTVYGYHRE